MEDKLFGIDVTKPVKSETKTLLSRKERHHGKVPAFNASVPQEVPVQEQEEQYDDDFLDIEFNNTKVLSADREQIVIDSNDIDNNVHVKGGD